MKKPRASRRSRRNYVCRSCQRDDFRTAMEYTNHLSRCKGPKTSKNLIATLGEYVHRKNSSVSTVLGAPHSCPRCEYTSKELRRVRGQLLALAEKLTRLE